MRKFIVRAFAILLLGIGLQGQAVPSSRFGWDQNALNLADAQAYTYKYYADGATTGVNFNNVTCSGATSPFQCSVSIPAFTPGNHTIQITATNIAGESGKSPPFAFVFVVTPSTPQNVRIVSGT